MTKDLKIFTDDIEDNARKQIDLLLNQEAFKDCKVRIMPDVHAGTGCVIGFTANLGDKVIPNIVGVDIGCGMLCINLGKNDLNLKLLDNIIRVYVPSGFNVHENKTSHFKMLKDLRCYDKLKEVDRIDKSLGTLGGGNHFIEIDVDEDNNKYLIIHSGSRNLGKQVAEYYQDLADKICNYRTDELKVKEKELIEKLKSENRQQEIQENLIKLKEEYSKSKNNIPKDLAYLEGKYRYDYLHDMKICQDFAQANRVIIAYEILINYFEIPSFEFFNDFSCFETIHNYISFEDNIVRKGAISAKKGEKVLIPMNMRDGCIIGIGKGNDDWNQSAPHGAGRIMSRMKARETIKLDDFKESMKNIYSTSVKDSTIDEAPMVYKPMQEIIDNIKDTVEIVKIIKPIYNFKADEDIPYWQKGE